MCDPFAVNFLASSAIKILQHLINNDGLPRDNTILILLLRMLALGLSAWVMIDSQDFKEPKLDSQVVTKYLPALMSLMVDDQVRHLQSRLPPDERESAITIIEHSGMVFILLTIEIFYFGMNHFSIEIPFKKILQPLKF